MKQILLLISLTILTAFAFSCDSDNTEDAKFPAPQILSVSTEYDGKAVSGKPVELTGRYFSPKASENKVKMGVGMDATSLEVIEGSESRLVFIAPKTDKEQITIRVSTKGKESNSVVLEFDNSFADIDISDIFEKGTTITVREGVEWTSFHGLWEGSIRNINIVKTTLNSHNKLGIYYDYKNTE